MSIDGVMSPRNARRFLQRYGLTGHQVVRVIVARNPWVVCLTKDHRHHEVNRATGEVELDVEPETHYSSCRSLETMEVIA